MKNLFFSLLLSLLCFAFVACDEETTSETTTFNDSRTIDCIIGYIWDGEQCVVNPSSIVVDSQQYLIFYEGSDYSVYKTTRLLEIGTDDVIMLGDYNERTYYFSSGTHYLYYLVVKGDEIIHLNEALESEWFSLEELVNQFEIEELYSYPIEE
ncbi:MAG: hypothetical protein JEZ05_00970 [Tenericutes bacterium]|nr:hypothetical protein [Mycoplasmatota bacterium]